VKLEIQDDIISRLIATGIATPATGVWWRVAVHYSDFKFKHARRGIKDRQKLFNETNLQAKLESSLKKSKSISIMHIKFYMFYLIIGCSSALIVFLVEKISYSYKDSQ